MIATVKDTLAEAIIAAVEDTLRGYDSNCYGHTRRSIIAAVEDTRRASMSVHNSCYNSFYAHQLLL